MPPLGLAYLAAALEREGHGCRVFDLGGSSMLDEVLAFDADIVGLSATSAGFLRACDLAAKLRQRTGATLVLGGPHVSVAGIQVLEQTPFDFALAGECELVLPRLVRLVGENATAELRLIPGLIYRDEGAVRANPVGEAISDLDALATPSYRDLARYNYRQYAIQSSRGCPYTCAFCLVPTIWGRRVRARSIDHVIDEMRFASRNYGVREFAFVDDTLNYSIPRAKALCEAMLRANLGTRWLAWSMRADLLDEELVGLMRRSRCQSVGLGIESADPAVLNTMRKGESIEEIARGIDLLARAGIPTWGGFMIGNTGDTLRSCLRSLRFAWRSRLTTVAFQLAVPYPTTDLWQHVEQHGRFLSRDYFRYDHHASLPVFETDALSASARRRVLRACRAVSVVHNYTQRLRILPRLTLRHLCWGVESTRGSSR